MIFLKIIGIISFFLNIEMQAIAKSREPKPGFQTLKKVGSWAEKPMFPVGLCSFGRIQNKLEMWFSNSNYVFFVFSIYLISTNWYPTNPCQFEL